MCTRACLPLCHCAQASHRIGDPLLATLTPSAEVPSRANVAVAVLSRFGFRQTADRSSCDPKRFSGGWASAPCSYSVCLLARFPAFNRIRRTWPGACDADVQVSIKIQ